MSRVGAEAVVICATSADPRTRVQLWLSDILQRKVGYAREDGASRTIRMWPSRGDGCHIEDRKAAQGWGTACFRQTESESERRPRSFMYGSYTGETCRETEVVFSICHVHAQ